MPEAKMSMEKRANPRISLKIPVKYRLVEDEAEIRNIEEWRKLEQNTYTLDMSLGGMYIAVDQPLKVGNIIKFDIYLLDMTNVEGIYAEVAHADQKGAGLHFLMMKNNDREIMKAFLDKFAAD